MTAENQRSSTRQFWASIIISLIALVISIATLLTTILKQLDFQPLVSDECHNLKGGCVWKKDLLSKEKIKKLDNMLKISKI